MISTSIITRDRYFDTLLDTNSKPVSIKVSFKLRDERKKDNLCPINVHLTGGGYPRERKQLPVAVERRHWDIKKECLKDDAPNAHELNLYLADIKGKIAAIGIQYLLSHRVLTPSSTLKELYDNMPRVKFVSFCKHALEEEKENIRSGTYRRYKAFITKVENYQPDVMFTDIDVTWVTKFKSYLKGKADNKNTTINSNLAALKKYLKTAKRVGIRLRIELEDIKVGSTFGNRAFLNAKELKRVASYYFSDFVSPGHKLTLGYFLFGCFTGLRLSDVQNLERSQLMDGEISFEAVKTSKGQLLSMNNKSIQILKHDPRLFNEWKSPEAMNRELKDICKFLKIKKKVSFHVSRHTFATCFLRVGGQVQHLQRLLNHTKIETTMVYVHILSEEANKEIFRLDDLF